VVVVAALGGAGMLAALSPAASPAQASETTMVQTFSEVLGRATVDGAVHVQHHGPTQVVVQRLTVAPGDSSGWHSHPGPHLVLVTQGHSTVFEADCTRHVYGPGDAFLVDGGQVHLARNEGTTVQQQLVVHFVSPDENLFIPEPPPRRCDVR
jgi:Cupin domain.